MNTLFHIVLLGGSMLAQGEVPTTCPSGSDMQLLIALHQRRLQLDTREAALNEREKSLQAMRDILDQRLATVSGDLEKFEARYKLGEPARQAREVRIRALVEAMTGLSAKKAAPMLAAAEADLTGDLLMRMGPARTANLLSLMPVQRAAKLMEQMGEKVRPAPGVSPMPAVAAPTPAPSAAPVAEAPPTSEGKP
jgi:flagellar motility protein MotE (MotC chaperone)